MYIDPLLKSLGLFTFLMILFAVAYGDNGPIILIKRLMCKIGWHKFHTTTYGKRILKYYCQYCKKSRSWPKLVALDGGNLFGQHKYKVGDKDENKS